MRKLDGDTKKIIELYKYQTEREYQMLIIERKEQIRNDIDEYVKEQEQLYLDYDKAIGHIKRKYGDAVKISHRFEVSNYASDYEPLYNKDEILKEYQNELNKIREERKNIMLALQFADSKSKEFKEALKKLEKE